MKRNYYSLLTMLAITLGCSNLKGQTNDDVINLLINKNIIKQEDADSLRSEAAIKAQEQKEKQKSFNITAKRGIGISGYIQNRFQSLQEAGKPDANDIRRARLDFKGNVTPTWEYRLHVDMAGTPKILDAIATFKPYDQFKIQAGQFKIPLSLENNTSSNNMEVIERAQVVEALVARNRDVIGNHNGRDIGIQAFGSILKIKGSFIVDYFVAGFQGVGINTSDNNEPKDFGARIVIHPIKGLDLGASYYNGFNRFGTIVKNEIRKRVGGEITYTYNIISIRGEYIQGEDGDFENKTGYNHIEREGWYGQLSCYVIAKKLQLVGRYDTYDPDKDKSENATTNVLGGVTFFFNDWAKLQVNYTSRNESGKIINNDIIGAQLQIAF